MFGESYFLGREIQKSMDSTEALNWLLERREHHPIDHDFWEEFALSQEKKRWVYCSCKKCEEEAAPYLRLKEIVRFRKRAL